jgi:hypothetical protein
MMYGWPLVAYEITDGHDPARTISKRFDFGEFNATGIGGNWTKEWTHGSDPI